MLASRSLALDTTLRLCLSDATTLPLPTLFLFDADDALAVTLKIADSLGRPVVWRIARDMLWAGLSRPTGDGDVRVGPTHGGCCIQIRLRNGAHEAILETAVPPLRRWLKDCLALVPWGAEAEGIDWDAALRALVPSMDPSADQ